MKNVLWGLAMAVTFAMATSAGGAEGDVILNPGTLSGSVSISGRSITSITVRAIDTDKIYSGTTSASVPAGAASIDYVLTLEGGHDYYVMAEALVSGTARIYAILPLAGPVHVAVGGDTPLDVSMVPATISGTISTGSNSNKIENYTIYAYLTVPEFDDPPYYNYTYAGNLNAPGGTGIDYTLLLAPGAKCYVQAYIDIDGLSYYFYDSDVTAPAAGGILDRDYPIDVTAASISGVARLQGMDVTNAWIRGYANSPSRENVYTIPDVSSGLYTLGVDEGSWRLRAEFSFHLPAPFSDLMGYLATTYSDPLDIETGEQLTDVDFIINPGFIPGTLSLWGPSTKIGAAQVEATAPCGYTYSDVAPATGAFLLVCAPDDWRVDYYQYLFFDYPDDPDTSLRSSVYQYYDSAPLMRTVQAGQTAPAADLTFGTIMVRRYFYVAGGGTLSQPYIRAIRKTSPYSEAYGYGSYAEKAEGQAAVTLLLPGTYTVEAFAHVNGSNTEFGPIDITVEEGDTVVIGGTSSPIIKLTNPTNGETLPCGKVTVEGTVADDRGVASITINGQAITFDPAQNPVAFSHEISINPGQNTITVVATDIDQTGPVTLTITVIGEAVANQYSLTVTSDDGGSVTVPGEGKFTYDSAGSVPIEATAADARYHFVRWTGTAVDAGKVADPNSAVSAVNVDGEYTLKANFVARRVTLTTSAAKGGRVSTPGEGSFEYDAGAAVLVQAEPNDANHYFTQWSGTGVDAGKVGNRFAASTTITMDDDYDLQARFAAYRCSLNLLSTPGGHANVILTLDNVSTGWLGDVACIFDSGTELTCMAFAEPGYRFTHWTGTIWSTADRIVFPLTEDSELMAHFVAEEAGTDAGQQ